MNAEPAQFDDIADVKLSGLIGEDLPRICGRFDAAWSAFDDRAV